MVFCRGRGRGREAISSQVRGSLSVNTGTNTAVVQAHTVFQFCLAGFGSGLRSEVPGARNLFSKLELTCSFSTLLWSAR